MVANFELSEKLRLFVQVGSSYLYLTLGVNFPVSIRRRYSWSQSIVIYPAAGYNFFMNNEVMCFLSLAKGLSLDSSVDVENGLPVITVTDYGIKNK